MRSPIPCDLRDFITLEFIAIPLHVSIRTSLSVPTLTPSDFNPSRTSLCILIRSSNSLISSSCSFTVRSISGNSLAAALAFCNFLFILSDFLGKFLIGIGLSSSDFSGLGSAGAGGAGVSPVVLDVDVGGWRRESREESMGIVSMASGDNASGRDCDCEAGRGVEMVGVEVILLTVKRC